MTPEQVEEAHADIRNYLATAVSPAVAASTRIVYAGNVTAASSKELSAQPDVDGFLVSGAVLTSEFVKIVNIRRD